MAVMLNSLLTTANQVPVHAAVVFVSSPLRRASMAILRAISQNNHKMAAFIGESDITKLISDYGKMDKY